MNSYYIKEKQGSMLDMLKAIYSRFNSLVKEARIIQYNNDIYLSHVDPEYELKECIKVSTLVSDAQEWLLCLESFVIDRCPNYINEHGINKYINKTIVPMINKCMESIIQLNEEVNIIKSNMEDWIDGGCFIQEYEDLELYTFVLEKTDNIISNMCRKEGYNWSDVILQKYKKIENTIIVVNTESVK